MGGFGHHHFHPDTVQLLALIISMLLPGGVFALLTGAHLEQKRRTKVAPTR